MGNITIGENIKNQIETLLTTDMKKAKYQNLKGFVDFACSDLLTKEKNSDSKQELMNNILKHSGLNWSNLMNSCYLYQNRDPIPENLSAEEKIKKNIENLGFKDPTRQFAKDTYYGLVTDYAWHNLSGKTGAGYSPINYLLDETAKKYPEHKYKLITIRRRITYLESLESEIEYIIKRYNLEKSQMMVNWLINKFEDFAKLNAELNLLLVDLFVRIKKPELIINNTINNKQIQFERELKYILDSDKFFQYLNATINSFIINEIRHEIVHNSGFKLEHIKDNKNEDFIIKIPEMSIKNDYGLLRLYIEDVINLFFNGKKIFGQDIIMSDPRFPYLSLKYRVSKGGTIDYDKTKITIRLTLKEYLKHADEYTFLLYRTLLQKLVLDNEDNKNVLIDNSDNNE